MASKELSLLNVQSNLSGTMENIQSNLSSTMENIQSNLSDSIVNVEKNLTKAVENTELNILNKLEKHNNLKDINELIIKPLTDYSLEELSQMLENIINAAKEKYTKGDQLFLKQYVYLHDNEIILPTYNISMHFMTHRLEPVEDHKNDFILHIDPSTIRASVYNNHLHHNGVGVKHFNINKLDGTLEYHVFCVDSVFSGGAVLTIINNFNTYLFKSINLDDDLKSLRIRYLAKLGESPETIGYFIKNNHENEIDISDWDNTKIQIIANKSCYNSPAWFLHYLVVGLVTLTVAAANLFPPAGVLADAGEAALLAGDAAGEAAAAATAAAAEEGTEAAAATAESAVGKALSTTAADSVLDVTPDVAGEGIASSVTIESEIDSTIEVAVEGMELPEEQIAKGMASIMKEAIKGYVKRELRTYLKNEIKVQVKKGVAFEAQHIINHLLTHALEKAYVIHVVGKPESWITEHEDNEDWKKVIPWATKSDINFVKVSTDEKVGTRLVVNKKGIRKAVVHAIRSVGGEFIHDVIDVAKTHLPASQKFLTNDQHTEIKKVEAAAEFGRQAAINGGLTSEYDIHANINTFVGMMCPTFKLPYV